MDATQAVQKFRSKYSGAYDKYNDSELLGALQKKYPGAYNHLTVAQEMQHPENILQRSAKVISSAIQSGMQNMSPLGVQANPKFPFLPTMPMDSSMLDSGLSEANMPITKGNPIADAGIKIAGGLGSGAWIGGKQAIKSAGESIENIKNPSKVFGRKIGSIQSANINKKVDFLKIVSKHETDPAVAKILDKSGVIGKYGGTKMHEGGAVTDNLQNLNLQDSQDFVNTLKSSVRQAVKEGVVKPTEIGISKLFSGLAKEQDSVFEGFNSARKSYGFGKNVGKAIDKTGKRIATGAAIGAGGTAAGTFVHNMMKK